MTRPVGDDDLMAWVDGRLLPERQALVDAYLAEHPDQSERLHDQAAQARALAAALASVAAEPIPAAMRVDALRPPLRQRAWRQALAASLLLGIGFGGGWMGARQSMPPRAGIAAFADEATDRQPRAAAGTSQSPLL